MCKYDQMSFLVPPVSLKIGYSALVDPLIGDILWLSFLPLIHFVGIPPQPQTISANHIRLEANNDGKNWWCRCSGNNYYFQARAVARRVSLDFPFPEKHC